MDAIRSMCQQKYSDTYGEDYHRFQWSGDDYEDGVHLIFLEEQNLSAKISV